MLDSFIIRSVHINDFLDISKIRKMPGVIEYTLALDNESPEKIKLYKMQMKFGKS